MTILYCLNFLDSPNLEGQVPVVTFAWNKVAQLYPQVFDIRDNSVLEPSSSESPAIHPSQVFAYVEILQLEVKSI
jgi:hypothetical protein